MSSKGSFYIGKDKLIKVYNQFKKKPFKTFVSSDFNPNGPHNVFREKHLYTLINLGLIEEVEAFVKMGRNNSAKKGCKGYRFIPLKRIGLHELEVDG